jgi:hypothetical protein
MRATTIAVCVLVAGGVVAFGFWWRANIQDDSANTPFSRADQTRRPIDGPAPAVTPAGHLDTSDGPASTNETDQHSTDRGSTVTVCQEGQRWREALASSDDQGRREALLELGKLQDTDPKLLTDALADDPAPDIRAAAARGLSRLKSEEAIPELLDALDDDDINVRTWAITGLNNTLVGVRFPYDARAPRPERLKQIESIRAYLERLEAHRASQP